MGASFWRQQVPLNVSFSQLKYMASGSKILDLVRRNHVTVVRMNVPDEDIWFQTDVVY